MNYIELGHEPIHAIRGISGRTIDISKYADHKYQTIVLANELEKSNYSKGTEVYVDSWDVIVNYGGGIYEDDYWGTESNELRTLLIDVNGRGPAETEFARTLP